MSGPVFVIDDGGTFTPLPQQEIPRWQETGFVESVACAAVHYAGQPYFPENPQTSRVELAVPWDTATALVHLLSALRSEEHTSELQSLMRISYAVFCLKKKTN